MKSNYSKVEGMLYGHYKRKNRLGSLNSRLIRIENRMKRLRTDIKECNVELGETMKGIDYSREPGGGSNTISNIERELERAVDKMARDLYYNYKDKYKTMAKVREIEKRIDDTEVLLEGLTKEEIEIIGLTYADILSERDVADACFMARSTLRRKKEDIINILSEKMDQKRTKGGQSRV